MSLPDIYCYTCFETNKTNQNSVLVEQGRKDLDHLFGGNCMLEDLASSTRETLRNCHEGSDDERYEMQNFVFIKRKDISRKFEVKKGPFKIVDVVGSINIKVRNGKREILAVFSTVTKLVREVLRELP